MLKGNSGRVKIPLTSKLDSSQKKVPLLKEGGSYFVTFGVNTYPCKLTRIIHYDGKTQVEVDVPQKPLTKRAFIDRNGEIAYEWTSTHVLFADEIGSTKEEAVINRITR